MSLSIISLVILSETILLLFDKWYCLLQWCLFEKFAGIDKHKRVQNTLQFSEST